MIKANIFTSRKDSYKSATYQDLFLHACMEIKLLKGNSGFTSYDKILSALDIAFIYQY